MRKAKYYYNTNTLRYEKIETPLRVKFLRVFGFVASALVTAGLIAYLAFQFIGSPKEKILELQNKEIREEYVTLAEQLQRMEQQMKELEKETMRSIEPSLRPPPFRIVPVPRNWPLNLK